MDPRIHGKLAKVLGLNITAYQEAFFTDDLLRNIEGNPKRVVFRFRRCLNRLNASGDISELSLNKIENFYEAMGVNEVHILAIVKPALQNLILSSSADRVSAIKKFIEEAKSATLPDGEIDLDIPQKKTTSSFVHSAPTRSKQKQSATSHHRSSSFQPSFAPTREVSQDTRPTYVAVNPERHGPPKVISFLNIRKGVGKTTLVNQLGEFLSVEFGKRVLLIDTDPQANLTSLILDDQKIDPLDLEGNSLTQIFKDHSSNNKIFDPQKAFQDKVTNLHIPLLKLLASNTSLWEQQMQPGAESDNILNEALKGAIKHFDYVLIDTPPELSASFNNAVIASDYYIVPTIADKLSTRLLPKLISHITEIANKHNKDIQCLGLLINQYNSKIIGQKATRPDLSDRFRKCFITAGETQENRLFKTTIPYSPSTPGVMRFSGKEPQNLQDKYGMSNFAGLSFYPYLNDFCKEVMQRVGA